MHGIYRRAATRPATPKTLPRATLLLLMAPLAEAEVVAAEVEAPAGAAVLEEEAELTF